MHIIQKSNVLNIKRKTSGSVNARGEQPRSGRHAGAAFPRTTVKDVNPQKNKPKQKGNVSYSTR